MIEHVPSFDDELHEPLAEFEALEPRGKIPFRIQVLNKGVENTLVFLDYRNQNAMGDHIRYEDVSVLFEEIELIIC